MRDSRERVYIICSINCPPLSCLAHAVNDLIAMPTYIGGEIIIHTHKCRLTLLLPSRVAAVQSADSSSLPLVPAQEFFKRLYLIFILFYFAFITYIHLLSLLIRV